MSRVIGKSGSNVAQSLGLAARHVIDAKGNRHRLAEELGRGGQGVVFRTANREIAVKLLLDSKGDTVCAGSTPDAKQMALAIERVRALPLPPSGIAVPLERLHDSVGYTMRLLDGMEPLARTMAVKGDPMQRYRETGGLRRRLELLARLADRLAGLHGSGLVFSDLSPNNIFVSCDTAFAEVWLIDPDNLHYLEHRDLRVYTPRYGAPEVVSGHSPVNTMTDCWSFAVIAHELLRMAHPFEGGAAEESGWDVTARGIAKAAETMLAWTDDPTDPSNRSTHGRPLDAVATERMKSLFERAFCVGRGVPMARPPMSEWADALWEAYDRAIFCNQCSGSTFVRAQGRHDCCDGRRTPVLRIESRLWLPDLDEGPLDIAQGRRAHLELEDSLRASDLDRPKPDFTRLVLPLRPPIGTMRVAVGNEAVIPMSLVESVGVDARRTPAIALKFFGARLMVRPMLESARNWVWIDPRNNVVTRCGASIDVPLPVGGGYAVHLHCGTLHDPHRVISMVLVGGGADAG